MAERKQYRKGEATRRGLMEAGLRVFAVRGFLRTQISDIVREAGKSTGVFYLYFQNKEDLLDAWLDECDKMVPWYGANTTLLFERAHSFIIKSYWSLYERFGPVLEALEAAALVNDHFRTKLDEVVTRTQNGFANMIRHAQNEGRYGGIDPELTAISMCALIPSTTAYWFRNRKALEERGFDDKAALANLETLYSRMLEGGNLAIQTDQPKQAAALKKSIPSGKSV